MKPNKIKLALGILCMVITFTIQAQIPPTEISDTTSTEFDEYGEDVQQEIDTVPVRYFFINNPEVLFSFSDTILGWSFHDYDPAHRDREYVHLGNLGSASRPLFYEITEHTEVNLGINVYDIYRKNSDHIRMFELGDPITDVFFSQYESQENSFFKALFNRKFSKGTGLGIDYQRINHQGIYLDQSNLNTNLTATGWVQNKKKSWHSYFSFIQNKFVLQDNGGIPALDALRVTGVEQDKNVVNVSLRNANTEDKQNMWFWKNLYYLTGVKDSTDLSSNKIWLELNTTLSKRSNQYTDSEISGDSAVYLGYWPDSTTINSFIKHRLTEVEFSLNYITNDPDSGSVKNIWKAFGGYQANEFDLDTVSFSRNSFFAGGKFKQFLTNSTTISGDGIIYLGKEASSFSLKGKLTQKLTRSFNLTGKISLINLNPGIRQELFYVNRQLIYDLTLKNPTSLILEGAITSPDESEKAGIRSYLLNQWIYHNSDALVTQSDQSVAMLQIFFKKRFKFGPFKSSHFIAYQVADKDEVIPLPSFYTRNSLFIEGYVFKKALNIQIGGQFQWNSQYMAPKYMPVINQFYNQREIKVGNYPLLDAIINVRVKSMRAFFQMENITDYFSDKVYFQHPYYPYPDPKLRIGIRWILRQ